MSDLHVWVLCKHGFAYNCPRFIDAEIMPERCPGGREIVFREEIQHAEAGRHVCHQYGCRNIYIMED